MSDASKKITKAKAGLVLDQPFFGALTLRLKTTESKLTETGWTDGAYIGYNPDWIDKLSLDKVKGFLAHEVMHLATGHQARRQNRDPGKWNVACDYAINQILVDSGFELPDTQCLNQAYRNKSAEEIYSLLPDNNEKDKGGSKYSSIDPGGCGGVLDAPGAGSDDQKRNQASPHELHQSEVDWKIAATQAAQSAKMMGNLPGAVKSVIEDLLEPKVDWRDILREFVERAAKNDYTFQHPNRRFISQGIILPSLNSKEIGTACVAVDTSGSVSPDELKQFASEVNSILEEYQDITIQVIYCDTRVAHVDEFHSSDMPVKMKMHGGGGTDFRPPFNWVKKNVDGKPTCMIYFTDMECNRFPDDPGYPTIWVQTKTMYSGSHWGNPPFGEVITMDMTGDPNSRRNSYKMEERKHNLAKLVRESIQTQDGKYFTSASIVKDIKDIVPRKRLKGISTALLNLEESGHIVRTGEVVPEKGRPMIEFKINEGSDWSCFENSYQFSKIGNEPESAEIPEPCELDEEEAVKSETADKIKNEELQKGIDELDKIIKKNDKPSENILQAEEEPKAMSALEMGEMIIDLINSYKETISKMSEEISRLTQRLKRADSVALEMERKAKLERNEYYKGLIKQLESTIERQNKTITELNLRKGFDSGKTFNIGELMHIRKQ